MDPVKYVAKYKNQLEAAGPELTFLQLAVPDEKSPIGWKPTARLINLVAYRKTVKKAKRLYVADIWYQLLDDYVFGYKSNRDQGSVFTRELLVALGQHSARRETVIGSPRTCTFSLTMHITPSANKLVFRFSRQSPRRPYTNPFCNRPAERAYDRNKMKTRLKDSGFSFHFAIVRALSQSSVICWIRKAVCLSAAKAFAVPTKRPVSRRAQPPLAGYGHGVPE